MRLKKKQSFLILPVLLTVIITAYEVSLYSQSHTAGGGSLVSTAPSSIITTTTTTQPPSLTPNHYHVLKKRYLSSSHVNTTAPRNYTRGRTSLAAVDKFPRVLIIGFAKTGTKALYEALKLHPQLSGPIKELRFFTEHYKGGAGGVQTYLDMFPGAPPSEGSYNIEKSPDYIVSVKAAVRLKQAAYDAGIDPMTLKLVVMVRNPIVRSVSDFLELKAWSILNKVEFSDSFADHVFDNNGQIRKNSKIVNGSCYSYHILNWFKHFARDQFCYVDGDAFITNPYSEIKSLEECLHLSSFFTPSNFVYNKVRGFYCFTSDNNNENHRTKAICMSRSKGRKHPYIEHDTIEKLRLFYTPLNQQLYTITNKTNLNWETSESY